MHLKNETFIYKMKVKKRANRSFIKKHRSCIIWLTGLSGAGKSTVADLLEQKLNKQNKHTFLLDGDNLRHTLNQDLGFSDDDRNENIRRIGHVGKLMVDAGLIVIASFISPFEKQRKLTRKLFEKDEYIEVFLNTPLEVCEKGILRAFIKRHVQDNSKTLQALIQLMKYLKIQKLLWMVKSILPMNCQTKSLIICLRIKF